MERKHHLSREMYRVAVFVVCIFKLQGLATISVKINEQSKKLSKETVIFVGSRLGICYNVFLGSFAFGINFVAIPILYNSNYAFKSYLTTIIEISQALLGTMIVTIITLYYCVNQSMLIKFANHLMDIEEELNLLRGSVDRRRIVYTLYLLYSFEAIMCGAVIISERMAFGADAREWFSSTWPINFVGFLFIQYSFVLTFMHAMFATLNNVIRNICVNRTANSSCLYCSHRVLINTIRIHSVLQLRTIHGHLCDVSLDISQFYSRPILLGTGFSFFVLLYDVYYFIEPLVLHNTIHHWTISLNCLLWLILVLYPFSLLTGKATDVVNEIANTGNIVHALLNCTIDRDAKVELRLFSLQLLHRKIRFTANDYFDLDNALFHSMLGTTATYLVILIQFQMGTTSSSDAFSNCTNNYTDNYTVNEAELHR